MNKLLIIFIGLILIGCQAGFHASVTSTPTEEIPHFEVRKVHIEGQQTIVELLVDTDDDIAFKQLTAFLNQQNQTVVSVNKVYSPNDKVFYVVVFK